MATLAEVDRCQDDFAHFAGLCSVLAAEGQFGGQWVPFRLWAAQTAVARDWQAHRLVVALKARQLGMTWLALAFALWHLLLHPVATVLLFSRRDDEAVDLLATRLRGMYDRLPDWLRTRGPLVDNDHEWQLSNGSRALAFPTTAGDSYTATLAVVDEADLVPDLDRLMRAVKPTIDAGGRMVLLSRADKTRPESSFKRVYRAARAGENGWHAVFLPWNAHPGRTPEWYAAQRQDILARTGSLDDLHEQYPSTDVEALSPRTLDKRIPSDWLRAVYREFRPLALESLPRDAPSVPGLAVYRLPQPGGRYVVGADPAEGNPTSDDSAFTVMETTNGEEVCSLAGKVQPEVLAAYAVAVALWYNRAPCLVERNNHGHAVLNAMRGKGVRLLPGRDGRDGWLSSTLGNAELYDRCAEAVRNREVVIHSLATFTQLASIDGNTLSAPPGQHDDRADAFALANVARPKAHAPAPPPPTGRGGVALGARPIGG